MLFCGDFEPALRGATNQNTSDLGGYGYSRGFDFKKSSIDSLISTAVDLTSPDAIFSMCRTVDRTITE
jgi:hypothetical protein